MPFGVRGKDGKFEVFNTETGEVKTTRDNRRDAERAAVLFGGGELGGAHKVGSGGTTKREGQGGPFSKINRALERARQRK